MSASLDSVVRANQTYEGRKRLRPPRTYTVLVFLAVCFLLLSYAIYRFAFTACLLRVSPFASTMQALPQLVPKTEVEFKANLGSVVSKSIELKNPSSKAIKYDVTLEGSTDFRTKSTEVGTIDSVA